MQIVFIITKFYIMILLLCPKSKVGSGRSPKCYNI
jgi:hypothetical protein